MLMGGNTGTKRLSWEVTAEGKVNIGDYCSSQQQLKPRLKRPWHAVASLRWQLPVETVAAQDELGSRKAEDSKPVIGR